MGGEEYLRQNGICIIEWGEQIEEILPKCYTKITFTKLDENERSALTRLMKVKSMIAERS